MRGVGELWKGHHKHARITTHTPLCCSFVIVAVLTERSDQITVIALTHQPILTSPSVSTLLPWISWCSEYGCMHGSSIGDVARFTIGVLRKCCIVRSLIFHPV